MAYGRSTRLFLLHLAVKNLSRHRKRTVITALGIALGIAFVVAFSSLMRGFLAEAERNFAWYEVGSAAITAPGYWAEREQFPLDMLVPHTSELVHSLERELAGVGAAVAPRIDFRGELIVHYDPFPEDGSLFVNVHAVDPGRDPQVFRLGSTVVAGRFLEAGEQGVLIGRWLADRLGAQVGYPVLLTTRTPDGYHQVLDLEIVGMFHSPNPTVNRSAIFVPLDVVQTALLMNDQSTRVVLALPESVPGMASVEPVRRVLADSAQRLPQVRELELLPFAAMTAEFFDLMRMADGYLAVMMGLLAIMAGVGISNTMLMAVMERESEIGMMRALGMRAGEVRRMFALEAAGVGVLGAIGGVMLGTVLVWLLTTVGLDYGETVADMADYRFAGVLYGVWNPGTMVLTAVLAVFLAAAVAQVPTRRILKRRVTDSLRVE